MRGTLLVIAWHVCAALMATNMTSMSAEEGMQFSVRARSPAVVVGSPVELLLQFTETRPEGSWVELGPGNLQNVAVRVTDGNGSVVDARHIAQEGFSDHSETRFLVHGVVEYGLLLNEFITLEKPGTYDLTVTIAGERMLSSRCTVILVSDGRKELIAIADMALKRSSLPKERSEAGRLLSYNFRPEAVPYLIELVQQHDFHGTRVMRTAIGSIMRSDEPAGIQWLWDQAAKGKVPALAVYKDLITSIVLKDSGAHPTRVKSEIVK